MRLLIPTGSITPVVKALAPRSGSLTGLRLGLLDNSKPNAGALLERLGELLAARAGLSRVRTWRKPGSAQPAEVLDEIAGSVDLVATGSAD